MKLGREKITCPNCGDTKLATTALTCHPCEVEIRGHFADNEFCFLTEEELHFLRVFIHSEGKLKDVERALGLSYPTVKLRLQQLKDRLSIPLVQISDTSTTPIQFILESIRQGEVTYEEGLNLIRELSLLKKGDSYERRNQKDH